jgi:hypothetical protein
MKTSHDFAAQISDHPMKSQSHGKMKSQSNHNAAIQRVSCAVLEGFLTPIENKAPTADVVFM